MITKRRPLNVPFLKPGRTLKTASLMTCNQHPLLRAGDSRRQSHMYTWTEDMRIERQRASVPGQENRREEGEFQELKY